MVEWLERRNEKITWCLVGEPSSTTAVGDVIKNGRRGSLGAELVVKGKQGHVAYPHLARNPIHLAAPALAELAAQEWDRGNEHFPATSFQVVSVDAGVGVENVVPGTAHVVFNLRFCTEQTVEGIQARVAELLDRHDVKHDLEWFVSGLPFLTPDGALIDATVEAVREATGIDAELSTGGGSSDGRYIRPTGAEVIELGPVNATIHKLNERVAIADLDALSVIYERIVEKLLV